MESRNLLPQNTRTLLPIIKHSACKLVHEVNVSKVLTIRAT